MASRTTRNILIIVCVVGTLGLLVILGCAGLVNWGMGTMTDLWQARVDADAFLDLFGAGKVDEAYAAAAPAFRTHVDAKQFAKLIDRYPALTKQERRSTGGMRMYFGATGPRAQIQYSIVNPNNSLSLMLAMVKADGKWKVESVNLP